LVTITSFQNKNRSKKGVRKLGKTKEKWNLTSQINHILWYFSGFIPLFIFVILLSFSTQLSNDEEIHFTSFSVINLVFLIVAILYGMKIYYDLHNFIKKDIWIYTREEKQTIEKISSENEKYTSNLIELILPIAFFPFSNIFGQIMYFFFLFLLLFLRLNTDNPYVNLLVAFKYNTFIGTEVIEPKEGGIIVYPINAVPKLFVYNKGFKEGNPNNLDRNNILILLRFLSIVLLFTIVISWVTYADLPYEFWNLTIGKLGGRWIWDGEIREIVNPTSQIVFTIGLCFCGGICLTLFILALKFRNQTKFDSIFFLIMFIGAFLYSIPRDNPTFKLLHYFGALMFINGLGVYNALTQLYRYQRRKEKLKFPKLETVIVVIVISINIIYTIGLFTDNVIGIDSEFISIFNALAQKLVVLISIISIWLLGKEDVGDIKIFYRDNKIETSKKDSKDRKDQRLMNFFFLLFIFMTVGICIAEFYALSIR